MSARTRRLPLFNRRPKFVSTYPSKALIQSYTHLAMGSFFWHGSHSFLGNVADNRLIDVFACESRAHQLSTSLTCHCPPSPAIRHLLTHHPPNVLSVITYQVSINNFLDPEGNQTTFAILRDLNTTLRSVSQDPVTIRSRLSPPHHPTIPPSHPLVRLLLKSRLKR